MPTKPDHEGYIVEKRYKSSDRRAYQSRRRKQIQLKSEYGRKKWASKRVLNKIASPLSVSIVLGVAVQTVYRWVRTARFYGYEALRPKSRRPKTIRTLPGEKTRRILDARDKYKCGCERIAAIPVDVSHMTVHRVLVRFEKIQKGKKIRRRWRHHERKNPNSMWQIDIKTVSFRDCIYTVSIIDDHY